MGKTFRHPQLAFVLCTQMRADPFAKLLGRTSHIHRNVIHLTLCDAHQFTLRMLNLIVQSTQDTLTRFTVVVLQKLHVQARSMQKITAIEALKKETACITKNLGLQN